MKLLYSTALIAGAVSGSRDSPFVVNNAGQIFKGASNGWTKLRGGLSDIGCNYNDYCWGVNSVGDVYWLDTNQANLGSALWTRKSAPFKGKAISISKNGAVWVVDDADKIWTAAATNFNSNWVEVQGRLVDIAAAPTDGEAWGVNRQGQLFKYIPNGSGGMVWQPAPNSGPFGNKSSVKASKVAACDNGDVVVVAADQGLWYGKNFQANLAGSWTKLDGYGTDAACKDNKAFVIGGGESIWIRDLWDPKRNTYWNKIAGAAVRIG